MRPQRVIETCLYVDDVEDAAAWYEDVLGLERVSADPPRHVFLAAEDSLVLLFHPGHTSTRAPGDKSPVHGARGVQHVAFAVDEVAPWRERLEEHGVKIVKEANFGDGDSVYVEDPAGNLVELVSRGTWPVW